jgi:hypothetical protein
MTEAYPLTGRLARHGRAQVQNRAARLFSARLAGPRSAWSLRPAMPFASDVCYGCVRAADL